MSTSGIDIDAKALMRQFDKLPDKVATKAARRAVNAGATPILRAARERVPIRSGLTRKALVKKTKAYPKNKTAVAIVGVSDKVSGTVDGKPHRPANILHLVHEGHVNRDGSFTPGVPFIKQANETAGDQAIDVMHDRLAVEIEKEASQL